MKSFLIYTSELDNKKSQQQMRRQQKKFVLKRHYAVNLNYINFSQLIVDCHCTFNFLRSPFIFGKKKSHKNTVLYDLMIDKKEH